MVVADNMTILCTHIRARQPCAIPHLRCGTRVRECRSCAVRCVALLRNLSITCATAADLSMGTGACGRLVDRRSIETNLLDDHTCGRAHVQSTHTQTHNAHIVCTDRAIICTYTYIYFTICVSLRGGLGGAVAIKWPPRSPYRMIVSRPVGPRARLKLSAVAISRCCCC